jgi:hypothetical protein
MRVDRRGVSESQGALLRARELPAHKTSEQPMQNNDGVGSANGIRTRVTAVRGRCPRPLDDSAAGLCVRTTSFRAEQPALLFSHGPLA